jgi:hypothetical protein
MIMRSIYRNVSVTLLILILTVPMSPSAQAHLMVAQHGTLNIVDDDNDGQVSMVEFNNHRAGIIESVEQNVTLSDKEENLPIQGIMLSPEVPLSQLVVMGRFSLAGAEGELCFQVDLFGKQSTEQLLKVTATRKSDSKEHVFELTPATPTGFLFP